MGLLLALSAVRRRLLEPGLGWFLLVLSGLTWAAVCPAEIRTLDERRYHLRSGAEPEWEEFVGKVPHGRRLDIRFTAKANQSEATLLIRQSDVKQDWNVEVNGKRLGKLFLMEAPLVLALPLPAGLLQD